jgi:hypothetical protein
MAIESLFNVIETVSLENGEPTTFIVIDTYKVMGRSYLLVVEEEDMLQSDESGAVPPLYGFEEVGDQLVPLNQEQLQILYAQVEADGDQNEIANVVTLQFDQDAQPVRFEEKVVVPFEDEGDSGLLVALFNVADDHDVRIVVRREVDGQGMYDTLPAEFDDQAREIIKFLSQQRRILRSVG